MLTYLRYKKYCTGTKSYWDLKRWFKKKNKGFTLDHEIDRMDYVFKKDFKVSTCNMISNKGDTIIYIIFDADNLIGRTAYGVKLDLVGVVGQKKIRECSLKEFIKIYGSIL
jgi:hypothetical protein